MRDWFNRLGDIEMPGYRYVVAAMASSTGLSLANWNLFVQTLAWTFTAILTGIKLFSWIARAVRRWQAQRASKEPASKNIGV